MLLSIEAQLAAAIRAGDRTLEVEALTGKVQALTYTGDWRVAAGLIEEILQKLPAIEDEVVRSYVLGDLGFYHLNAGDLSRAVVLLDKGVNAARSIGDRNKESRFHLNLGCAYTNLGLYPQARATLEAGLALAEAAGDRSGQTSFKYNLSYVYWCSDDRDRARALAEEALQDYRTAVNNPMGKAACLSFLGFYLEAAMDWDSAAACLAEARAIVREIDAESDDYESMALEARVALAQGNRKKAQQLAAELRVHLREHGTDQIVFPPLVYLCLADVFGVVESSDHLAREMIELGYQDLMQRAEKISDTNWRRSFLENIAENKELTERWKIMDKGDA